ncbi:hypothetical protein P3C29_24255 [Pseudomonas sp. 1912-s]|nr:hypothetical protein [Pseudomonas sp. 1912-s]MDF3201813.1 hypothetical protein [Pseudomonas sp. 1912-s]
MLGELRDLCIAIGWSGAVLQAKGLTFINYLLDPAVIAQVYNIIG